MKPRYIFLLILSLLLVVVLGSGVQATVSLACEECHKHNSWLEWDFAVNGTLDTAKYTKGCFDINKAHSGTLPRIYINTSNNCIQFNNSAISVNQTTAAWIWELGATNLQNITIDGNGGSINTGRYIGYPGTNTFTNSATNILRNIRISGGSSGSWPIFTGSSTPRNWTNVAFSPSGYSPTMLVDDGHYFYFRNCTFRGSYLFELSSGTFKTLTLNFSYSNFVISLTNIPLILDGENSAGRNSLFFKGNNFSSLYNINQYKNNISIISLTHTNTNPLVYFKYNNVKNISNFRIYDGGGKTDTITASTGSTVSYNWLSSLNDTAEGCADANNDCICEFTGNPNTYNETIWNTGIWNWTYLTTNPSYGISGCDKPSTVAPSWTQTIADSVYEYSPTLVIQKDANATGTPNPVFFVNDTGRMSYVSATGVMTNKTSFGLGVKWFRVFSGNSVANISDNFTVTIQDTTNPICSIPANVTNCEYPCNLQKDANMTEYLPDKFSITANYTINSATGIFKNASLWNLGTFYATITGNDTSNLQCSKKFKTVVVDTTPPVLTIPANFTITVGTAFSKQMNMTDYFTNVFLTNDTTRIKLNVTSGIFTNGTLAIGVYHFNITANDTTGNLKSKLLKITVTALPLVEGNLSLLVTNSTLYEAVNTWFNITGTVTCGDGDVCADTNMTISYDLADCELYLGYNSSYWIGNLTVGNSEKRTWKAKCTVAGYYNFTINATDTQNYLDNRTQIYFVSGGGGGLTIQEHNWLQAIYNEVGNMNLTIIYVFFLVVATTFMGMYAFKRDKPREEGSRGFILGTIAWFLFLALTFISFHLELAWLRMPSAWLFGGISLIIGISLFVDVWASWKKI